MAKKTTTPPAEQQPEFLLEEKLREIREILQKMQLGGNDFDENIRLFQRGNVLIEACRKYLDTAEVSVKQLVNGPNGPEMEDFD